MIDADSIKEAAMVIKSGLLAAAGGVVGYLVDVHRGKQFSWIQYGIFVMVAFFVGEVLDSFLPMEMPGKGGVLMVAGTSAYPILVVLQTKVANMVEKLQ